MLSKIKMELALSCNNNEFDKASDLSFSSQDFINSKQKILTMNNNYNIYKKYQQEPRDGNSDFDTTKTGDNSTGRVRSYGRLFLSGDSERVYYISSQR